MKAWQKIVIGILIVVFILLFGIGYIIFDILQKFASGLNGLGGKEGFQVPTTPSATDPNDPGSESYDEQVIFDVYEQNNLAQFFEGPPTTTPAFDPSTTLGDFDEDAPVPWDFDNKLSNPTDVLWGVVDHRCSVYLWEAARMRLLFDSANNFEIDNVGKIGYYSSMLNGRLFHDPVQIVAVQYADFIIDFANEEIVETTLDVLGDNLWGHFVKAAERARESAAMAGRAAMIAATGNKFTIDELTSMKNSELLEKTGKTRSQLNSIRNQSYSSNLRRDYKAFSKDPMLGLTPKQFEALEAAEKNAIKSKSYVARATHFIFNVIDKSLKRIYNVIGPAISKPAKAVIKTLAPKSLLRIGEKAAGMILAKMTGMRSGFFAKLIVKMMAQSTIITTIPIIGQAIGWIFFLLSVAFIAIIPPILSDQANLDENPESSNCGLQGESAPFNACPKSHPFNLRCAIVSSAGEFVWNLIQAIPAIGDGMGAFAPYLCTNSAWESVFRQSFQPPDYYFDSSLSIFYAEKPKILSGDQSKNNANADPQYYDPGLFKLIVDPPDQFYHPWVDFSNVAILDKMAQFYYDNSKKNQVIDIDGNATFQYIYKFKGLIASSQLSCDVQVELTEIKYRPYRGNIISQIKLQNPYETSESIDTGCSFHDRRFYFTIDYTKAEPDNNISQLVPGDTADTIATKVNRYLNMISPAERIKAFMRMFIVIGCTNSNGSAPNVTNSVPDGDYVGDAPIGLGEPGKGYIPPTVDVGQPINSIPASSCSQNAQGNFLRYGVNKLGSQRGSKNEHGINIGVYLPDETDFTEGLTASDPTKLSAANSVTIPRYIDYFLNNRSSGANVFNFVFNSEYSGPYSATDINNSDINYLRDLFQMLLYYYRTNIFDGLSDDTHTTTLKSFGKGPTDSLADLTSTQASTIETYIRNNVTDKSRKYECIMNILRRNNVNDPIFTMRTPTNDVRKYQLNDADANGALAQLILDRYFTVGSVDGIPGGNIRDPRNTMLGEKAVNNKIITDAFRQTIAVENMGTLISGTTASMSTTISKNHLYIMRSVDYANISTNPNKPIWVKENHKLWPWPRDYSTAGGTSQAPAPIAVVADHTLLPTTSTVGIAQNTVYRCSTDLAPYILRGVWTPVSSGTHIGNQIDDYESLVKVTASIDDIFKVRTVNYINKSTSGPATWVAYTGMYDPSITVNSQSDLPEVATENIIYTVTRAEQLFKYSQRWVPYSPMPIWQNSGKVGTTWDGSTKYWMTTKISRTGRQRFWSGLQTAVLGSGPLFFGFTGGMVVTTMDVGESASISNAISCTYQDMTLQTGTYTVNGFLKTSQNNFLIDRGPAIFYAPGYKPKIQFHINRRLTRLECADRYPIRRMVKMYNNRQNGTRRVKRVLGIEPRLSICVYDLQDIAVNRVDKTDIPESEGFPKIGITHRINTDDPTSTFIPDQLTYTIPEPIPIPYNDGINNPQVSNAEFNSSSNNNFKNMRRGCTYPTSCDDADLQSTIKGKFNESMMTVPGNLSTINPEITNIVASKTPPPEKYSDNNICYYKIEYSITKNINTPRLTKQIHNLRVVLDEDPANQCGYIIKSHNFPKNMFYASIPRNGEFIELPPTMLSNRSILRTSCTREYIATNKNSGQMLDQSTLSTLVTSYSDCSGTELMGKLVTDFNLHYDDRKILRVTKSYTPQLTNNALVCDYEVDILRKLPNVYPIIERDTIRIPIIPDTVDMCLYDIDFSKLQYVPYRSGKTINKNPSSQDLENEYSWPMQYLVGIRRTINEQISRIIPLDITGYMSTLSKQTKDKLSTITKTLGTSNTVKNCSTATVTVTFQDPILVNAIINRYNFDGTPPYTATNQFGSMQRSIVQVRRCGQAGEDLCHVEVIEKQEIFSNWLLKPDTSVNNGINNSAVYANAKFYLKKYLFAIERSGIVSNQCVISMQPISQSDMDKQSFEIINGAYGIESDATIVQASSRINYVSPQINPALPDVYKSLGPAIIGTYSGQITYTLTTIRGYVNIRPNIIEYDALVTKRVRDPYFGITNVPNVPAFITAIWNETQWNPSTGSFIYMSNSPGVTPTPVVDVFLPSDVVFMKDSNGNLQITINGTVRIPPYSYMGYDSIPTGFVARGVSIPQSGWINVTP